MKQFVIGAAIAALAVPASALGVDADNASSASQTCKAQRTAMGSTAFAQMYGTNANKRNAFGKCVSRVAKAQASNDDAASKACRTEQQAGENAFAVKYGTNKNGKNAFGKCVSAKSDKADHADHVKMLSAVKSCKAERKADAKAFSTKYRNLGRCVSSKAKAGRS